MRCAAHTTTNDVRPHPTPQTDRLTAVIAGIRRAQAAGKHCGRPRKEIDLRPAVALLREGRGLKDVARILKVPRATLRRRLEEVGEWPRSRPTK